jgi:tRNA wybutosine-synthesizing protein 4
MINRGTWSRVYAVSRMLLKFVDFVRNFNETNNTNIPVQILSLGAGFDTSFFNLKSTFPNVCFNYIEVDYQEVVVKKVE